MSIGTVTMKVSQIHTDEPDMKHSHIIMIAERKDGGRVPEPLHECIHQLTHDHYEIMEWFIQQAEINANSLGMDFKLVQLVSE